MLTKLQPQPSDPGRSTAEQLRSFIDQQSLRLAFIINEREKLLVKHQIADARLVLCRIRLAEFRS